jgi:uncharacterized protein YfiM (DUF2279 family)
MTLATALLAAGLAFGPAGSPDDRWLAEDKLKHFFTSFVATSLAASGARVAGLDRERSLVLGAGAGLGAGVLKEIHDARAGGGFSYRDLLWDLAGIGAAAALVDASR